MKIFVNAHSVNIKKNSLINEKEINVTTCEFEFSEDYTIDLVKEAIFTYNGNSYKVTITNNQCEIPYEVLNTKGEIELGVIAYEVEDEEYIKRFNPTPTYFSSFAGSIKDKYENSSNPTPSEIEQLASLISDKQDILISGENIKTINNKSLLGSGNIVIQGGSGGTSDYKELSNKPSINNVELSGNKTTSDLGIEIPDVSDFITKGVDDLTNYYTKTETYTQNEVNGLINAITTINMLVVQTLPTEDISTTTIYLVPKSTAETNNIYDEYVYTNNSWEKIGDTQADLSNYYTKSEVEQLIANAINNVLNGEY